MKLHRKQQEEFKNCRKNSDITVNTKKQIQNGAKSYCLGSWKLEVIKKSIQITYTKVLPNV